MFPAEPDYAVAEIALLFFWDKQRHNSLGLEGVFVLLGVKSESAANADAMGVGNDAAHMINVAKQKVGYLSAHAGEFQQLIHAVWQHSAVFIYEHCALGFDVG